MGETFTVFFLGHLYEVLKSTAAVGFPQIFYRSKCRNESVWNPLLRGDVGNSAQHGAVLSTKTWTSSLVTWKNGCFGEQKQRNLQGKNGCFFFGDLMS